MKKTTKRALLLSVCSLLLCVVMLVGTTFAWFTDTATTGVNKIQSGKLDIDIVDTNGKSLQGKTLGWKAADNRAQDEIFWEPGATYDLQSFKIVNNGNLALKYKVTINGVDGDSILLNAIDFTVKMGNEEEGTPITEWEGILLPKGSALTDNAEPNTDVETTKTITISGHMKEEAGNEYQEKEITGLGITVVATQYTYESDSYNNTYDEKATYPVVDYAGLKEAIAKGGVIALNGNVTADKKATTSGDRLVISSETTLNLDGLYTVPGELEDSNNWAAFYITADTTINATKDGGIACVEKTDASASYQGGPYAVHVTGGATVTVNGGNFYAGGTTFNVENGTLIVNGGFFKVYPDIGTGDYRYNLNCIDSSYKNGTAKIIVKGGTFVNFDPSNNLAEGTGTNFVADGYKVVSETQANGEIWYTVVPE